MLLTFLDTLQSVQDAPDAKAAFASASAYYHDLGLPNVGVTVATLEAAPDGWQGVKCKSVGFREFSGDRDTYHAMEEYSHARLFDTDISARPAYFGNLRPFRIGSELNHHLANPGSVPYAFEETEGNTALALGVKTAWNVPILTNHNPLSPIAMLSLYGSADTEAEFARIDGMLGAISVIGQALSDRMRGDILRTELGLKPLTQRERECLTFVAAGYRVAQISDRLSISRHTVDTHLRAARVKLKALTLAHAVARAIQLGEITP